MSAQLPAALATDLPRLLLAATCVAALATGLLLNCAVLAAQTRPGRPSDALLRSLALSDGLLLLALSLRLPGLLLRDPWALGHALCGAYLYLAYLAHLSAGLALVALSLHRGLLLLRPGWGQRGSPRTWGALCCLIWLTSLLFAAPAGLLARAKPEPPTASDPVLSQVSTADSAPVLLHSATESGPVFEPPAEGATGLEQTPGASSASAPVSTSPPQNLFGAGPQETSGVSVSPGDRVTPPPVSNLGLVAATESTPPLPSVGAVWAEPQCAPAFPASARRWAAAWKWGAVSVGYLLPLATMLACYCPLLARLCSAGRRFPGRGPAARSSAVRVLGCVGAFLLCWTPAYALVLSDPRPGATADSARRAFLGLGALSAGVNPLLYSLLDWGARCRGNPCPSATLRGSAEQVSAV